MKVDYKFGTMIEVPRGALTADEIATEAEFFSFGTNDLTQMTFGFSRDDAEGGFLLKYVEDKILPVNPFQTLDDAVVGLMKIATDKGRATRPGLEVGICGGTAAIPTRSPSARRSASTTCPARRSACRSLAWPRRRRRSRWGSATSRGGLPPPAHAPPPGVPVVRVARRPGLRRPWSPPPARATCPSTFVRSSLGDDSRPCFRDSSSPRHGVTTSRTIVVLPPPAGWFDKKQHPRRPAGFRRRCQGDLGQRRTVRP